MLRSLAPLALLLLPACAATPAGSDSWLAREIPPGSRVLAEGAAARLLPIAARVERAGSLADLPPERLRQADFLLLDSRAWRQRFHPRRSARRLARYRELVRDAALEVVGLREGRGTRLLLLRRRPPGEWVAGGTDLELTCQDGRWRAGYEETRPFGLVVLRVTPPAPALWLDGQPVGWREPGVSEGLDLWAGPHRIELEAAAAPRLRVERALDPESLSRTPYVEHRAALLGGVE